MGDLKSGLLYGKKYQTALSYSLSRQIHSEKFTYEYLKERKVHVLEVPIRFWRIRASGQVTLHLFSLYFSSSLSFYLQNRLFLQKH
jgi:hypothetical protein